MLIVSPQSPQRAQRKGKKNEKSCSILKQICLSVLSVFSVVKIKPGIAVHLWVFAFIFWFQGLLHGSEVDQVKESAALTQIRQLTFSSMGFVKAGEAYFSPDSRSIIFQAVPTGKDQYQIYVMNLDENIPRMVSTGKGACTCSNFRPDGKKIIFASSHESPIETDEEAVPGYQRQGGNYAWAFTPYMNVYEADPDGSHLKALTTGSAYHAECAYSSDGTQIVFASNEDGHMNIYTMRADGSELYQVTKTASGYNGGPFFSPDGSKIIFRADYEKPDYLQIYLINSDGTNLQQLTHNGAVNWAPYWHPNGSVIAFTSSIHGHGQYEIYMMNILTNQFYRLTYHRSFDGLPVFNREGDKLLWTSKRSDDGSSQIFIADFTMPSEFNPD